MGSGIPDGKTFRELIKEPRFTIALLVFFLPFLIWAARSITEVRKKAAEGDTCIPINKVITVTPPGGTGTCHDLQMALDAVPSESTSAGDTPNSGFTIRLTAGTYTVPESGNGFSIVINNKNRLTIVGAIESNPQQTRLEFFGNTGGINIGSSVVNISGIEVNGRTTNGIVRVENSPNILLANMRIFDQGANTIHVSNTSNFQILHSDIQSSSVGVYLNNVNDMLIANSTIHNTSVGVTASESRGVIGYNLFANNRENALQLVRSRRVTINNNTITTNTSTNPTYTGAISSAYPVGEETNIFLQRNIVAFNTGNGISVHEDNVPASSSGTYTFDRNDFFNNTRGNFDGVPNPVNTNGNISADPRFGTDHCLLPGSPAILTSSDYMGHRGPCPIATATPTPTTTTTPTPTTRPDDLFFGETSTPQIYNTFLIAQGDTPISTTSLIPGQPYQVTFNAQIQNIVKTTTIDSRPVIVTLQVNGVPLDDVSMYYSLVANHANGAGPGPLTSSFIAQQTNVFEVIIDKANTLPETNETNNTLTRTIPGATPTPTTTVSPTPTLTPTITLTPTPTQPGQRLTSFSFFTPISGITRNRGSIPVEIRIGAMNSSAVLYSATVSTGYQRDDIYQGTVTGTSDKPLPEVLTGNAYWIMLKSPHSVRRAYTNLVIPNNTLLNLSGKRLEAGDLPAQDGYVNHKDINIMLGIIASPTQSRSNLDTADVNRDGRVNAIDFGLLLRGLALGTDEVAP